MLLKPTTMPLECTKLNLYNSVFLLNNLASNPCKLLPALCLLDLSQADFIHRLLSSIHINAKIHLKEN